MSWIGKSVVTEPLPVVASTSAEKSFGAMSSMRPLPVDSVMSSLPESLSISTRMRPLPLEALTGPAAVCTETSPLPLDAVTGPCTPLTSTRPFPLDALRSATPAATETRPLPLDVRRWTPRGSCTVRFTRPRSRQRLRPSPRAEWRPSWSHSSSGRVTAQIVIPSRPRSTT